MILPIRLFGPRIPQVTRKRIHNLYCNFFSVIERHGFCHIVYAKAIDDSVGVLRRCSVYLRRLALLLSFMRLVVILRVRTGMHPGYRYYFKSPPKDASGIQHCAPLICRYPLCSTSPHSKTKNKLVRMPQLEYMSSKYLFPHFLVAN